jgi:MYXO-CTERM domain-containing protein
MNRLALVLALCAILAPATAVAGIPSITRDKIIELAKSGVGCPYVWGGTCWDPSNHHSKGADCSGYVTKCWQIPSASAVTSCTAHYYSTSVFLNSSTYWSSVSRSSLIKGDALVHNNGSSGHIILFESYTSTSGCYWDYEARGSAYGIQHRIKCPDSSYYGRRRDNITAPAPPAPTNNPPKGYFDLADCTAFKGWAQDPDAKTTSISVKIYVDGAPGQSGVLSYTAKADQTRSDLVAAIGSANHGFEFATPAKLKDGKAHTVRVFAVDTAGGTNPELTNSPKKITCAAPLVKDGGADPDPQPDDAGAPSSDAWQDDPPAEGDPSLEVQNDQPENDPNEARTTGGCSAGPTRGAAGGLGGLLALAVLGALLAIRRRRG